MVTVLIVFLTERERVLDWASEHIKDKEGEAWEEARRHIENNIDIARYIIIATTSVTLLVLFFGMFYRCSVSSNKSDHHQDMRNKDRYQKVSNEIQEAQARKEEKQRLYAEKYGINPTGGNNNQML
eukprot:CAMPEP_0196996840 /NCGR_PEP_ID=MMETSP1380-20130617/2626_1 /TAXON_ID=5936 /ORGANISM="Euplotes crassus, Strain CT5" /LENGTH=125 /DNA_ID=CAMNT_0042412933 /DNA_START=257 /DNA_END=634 /DNA_ORIENTATION=+